MRNQGRQILDFKFMRFLRFLERYKRFMVYFSVVFGFALKNESFLQNYQFYARNNWSSASRDALARPVPIHMIQRSARSARADPYDQETRSLGQGRTILSRGALARQRPNHVLRPGKRNWAAPATK